MIRPALMMRADATLMPFRRFLDASKYLRACQSPTTRDADFGHRRRAETSMTIFAARSASLHAYSHFSINTFVNVTSRDIISRDGWRALPQQGRRLSVFLIPLAAAARAAFSPLRDEGMQIFRYIHFRFSLLY